MTTEFRCPGIDEASDTHEDGCCARFALMSDESRAAMGRPHGPRPRTESECLRPPDPDAMTVPQLIELIKAMQRRAAMLPDEDPPGATVWVEYGPSYTLEDIVALYEQGSPYGLVLGHRRVPYDPK